EKLGGTAEENKLERRRRAKQRRRANKKGDGNGNGDVAGVGDIDGSEPKSVACGMVKLITSMIEPLDDEYSTMSIDGIRELRKWLKMQKDLKREPCNLVEEVDSLGVFFEDLDRTLTAAYYTEVKDPIKGKNKLRNKGKNRGVALKKPISHDIDLRQSWNSLMNDCEQAKYNFDEALKEWDAGIEAFELRVNNLETGLKEWNKVVDIDTLLKGGNTKWKQMNTWRDRRWYPYLVYSRSVEFSVIDIRNAILTYLNGVLVIDFEEIPPALEAFYTNETTADLDKVYQISLNIAKAFKEEIDTLTSYLVMSMNILKAFGETLDLMMESANERIAIIAKASSSKKKTKEPVKIESKE
ncbi:hypothetical protein C0J52_04552, partial [Blattella germanica]